MNNSNNHDHYKDYDDISSNSKSENEEKDLFSYDNSGNIVTGSESFDLNSFSSPVQTQEKGHSKKKNKKNKKKKGKQGFLKVLLSLFLIGTITVSLVVGCFMFYAFTMVDGTMDEDITALDFTTTIYVDNGQGEYSEYQRLHGEFNRIWVDYIRKQAQDEKATDYEGIPEKLATAFIAIEDKRFRDHDGIDWKRTISAFVNEFVPIYSSRQGGSTITQQLVKNLTDDRSQKASRKVREIMRARFLEGKYSKDEILEAYLNTIPLGHGTYGVQVAANYYFGKNVKDLTLIECACLASITKSPSYYAPDTNPENNKERRNDVLYEMYDQGYITKEEYDSAISEELKLVTEERVLNQNKVNSYFVDALIEQVAEDLAEKYGYEKEHAVQMFYNGGYKIYATVDTKMQEIAESVFTDSKTYAKKSKKGQTLTGSMTILDYSGSVKAIVGGIGEKTTNRGFNNATQAVRQPGSTMKPIAAYAPAIEQDIITYSTIVNDTRTTYNKWTPVNWYKSYWGNMTVQYALERSVNTIPVYLVDKLSLQTSFDFLTQKLGVKNLTPEDVNYSPLGMGGTRGGLTTLESAAAFQIFGNSGHYYEPSFYTKVTNQDGKVILTKQTEPKMAISEDTATIMNHLLQTVVYGANGTGKSAASFIPQMKIYAKTGTSNNASDLWFVGGSPYYVASCWCGYGELENVSDSSIARRMWGAVMSKIHSGLEAKEFVDSDYTLERYYCPSSGKLATSSCPSRMVGWYKKSNLPGSCTYHTGELLGVPGSEPVPEATDPNATPDATASQETTPAPEATQPAEPTPPTTTTPPAETAPAVQ